MKIQYDIKQLKKKSEIIGELQNEKVCILELLQSQKETMLNLVEDQKAKILELETIKGITTHKSVEDQKIEILKLLETQKKILENQKIELLELKKNQEITAFKREFKDEDDYYRQRGSTLLDAISGTLV